MTLPSTRIQEVLHQQVHLVLPQQPALLAHQVMGEGYLQQSSSIITSGIEGYSLKELERIWQDLASSEMRLKMMDTLQLHKVGFNDVENFNLGLIFNAKMLTHDNYTEREDKKVVEAAMRFKKTDEIMSVSEVENDKNSYN